MIHDHKITSSNGDLLSVALMMIKRVACFHDTLVHKPLSYSKLLQSVPDSHLPGRLHQCCACRPPALDAVDPRVAEAEVQLSMCLDTTALACARWGGGWSRS